jgi:transposase InsO family protein
MNNGKPKTVMHDNGKQFTSKAFKHFLVNNNIGDKRIPIFHPQMQGKIEAYNKIVRNEFLALEDIPNISSINTLFFCNMMLKKIKSMGVQTEFMFQ